MNLYAILQRAQLLEGFRLLQRRRLPADEAEQQIAPVAVDALVAEIGWRRRARERDRAAREK